MLEEKRGSLRLSVVLSFLFSGLIMVAIFITNQMQRLEIFGIYALAIVIIYALYIRKVGQVSSM